ncbi:MAG: Glycosyl transferase family 2 [Candidatus Magasanikbacteria bacterium GW2011_GWA2_56_11]|uniref:Glycosyl transferase family 2 n=1 Tax=Candidatus Magasanikbacteria bacterium GW2011_GWA2_56_11 TaxID=1619044 RepID=A0A0G2B8I5_9BACT|nr:MAG: Glycosyl transferase family 2 [Candidatus Magasanikbacteria bacterium GW2011_GWA2_56_11]
MDLTVVTVTWNSSELILEQLRSVVAGCQGIAFEQIVVDNDSKDNTVALVREHFPGVRLIANAENKGFAAANNQGAAIARGDFLLFLNPDMRVEAGSIFRMLSWMKARPEVGIASCKLVDEHGRLNEDAKPRRFPDWPDQLAIVLKWPHFWPGVLNRYLLKDFNADREQEVDSVRGSFLLMRRALTDKLGWAFDPRYYIWFEDVDICREARRLGYRVVHTPIITCVDYVGQSFKKQDTLWKQKQFTRSMLRYFKKWEPRWKWAILAASRPVGIALAWGHDKLKG